MFLRNPPQADRRRKDGKAHWYWALVESVRVGAKVRQRIVAYLGDVADEEARGWEHLVRRLDGRPLCERDLFERPQPPAKPVEIFPDRVRVERVRDFGDAFVGLALWRYVGLDRFFAERMARGREAVAWATMVAYATVARFCEPTSELATADSFTDRSALADLLGLDPLAINEDRLYRTLDQALKHKSALASHLRSAYADLFGADYDLLLYDLTSTYFEGQAAGIAQARYGYSRDKRSDCKQVIVALIVTREGLPLDFEIFDGNRRDHQTLQQIVEAVEAKFGRAGRIWVMDRGLATEDNLAWLRGRGGFYLVGTPNRRRSRADRSGLPPTPRSPSRPARIGQAPRRTAQGQQPRLASVRHPRRGTRTRSPPTSVDTQKSRRHVVGRTHRRPLSAARPSRRTTHARPILARLHSTDPHRGSLSQIQIQPRRPSHLPQNTAPRSRSYLSELSQPRHAPVRLRRI